MGTLISNATGNLTGAATFAAAEVGAGALALVRTGTSGFSIAGTFTSPTFTVTNGKVIDAILLWVKQTAAGGIGTFKVDLQKGGVSQASVTVNKADLPDVTNSTTVPVLFKLTSTATGDGGSNWTFVVTTTGTVTSATFSYSSSTSNPTHALRTTTAATPAAADDLYIVGELTGAGTNTPRTVTMDSTAATAYGNGALNTNSVAGGGIHISNYGTLSYGTTGATNYVLRVNGDLIVYQNGALNVGSSGAGSGFATLNSADKDSHIALSGGNLTALGTAGWTGLVRAVDGKSAGKFYFECTFNAAAAQSGVGVAISSLPVATTTFSGSAVAGHSGLTSSGTVWVEGSGFLTIDSTPSSVISFGTITSGTVICVAIDLAAKKIWFRLGAGGNWNNLAGRDPATGVGGAIITNVTTAYPTLCFGGADTIIANFGATAFAGAVPSGFTSGWPVAIPASTAVLEFQQLSADGDFGLRCLDNSVTTITGQPRTSGKNVVKCKLTADVTMGGTINPITQNNAFSGSLLFNGLEASGNSLLAGAFSDNSNNNYHGMQFGPSTTIPANTTQTVSVWLARGTGAANRYIRLALNGTNGMPLTNGFQCDLDLQAGTAGTVTAVGAGVATSISMTPLGTGFLVRMIGKVNTGAASNPTMFILACSVPGTIIYVGNTTNCFVYDHPSVVTTASPSDTTFNVDTDTGWLSGDAICVAPTTRSYLESEIYPLGANAGASSLASALYPSATHHGTSPIQAEIGLITRNVKIRSTSNTLMTYVSCAALATVTASWAEFYYVGANASNKRGIDIDCASSGLANAKSFTYCSLHDVDNYGLAVFSGGTSLNLTFSNSLIWNTLTQPAIFLLSAISGTDWTFDSNLFMRIASGGLSFNDVGGICTNNTVTGSAGTALILGESSPPIFGNFDGNTAHSNASIGFQLNSGGLVGTFTNLTAWRNGNYGISQGGGSTDIKLVNPLLFGNTTVNVGMSFGDYFGIIGGTIASEANASFATAYGFSPQIGPLFQFELMSVDFSGSGSIFAPHTINDVYYSANATNLRGTINNCKFGAATVLSAKVSWGKRSYIGIEKYNQTAGDHRTEMAYGQLKTDSAIYNTAAPSMRMTPSSASLKLESATAGRGIQAAVNSGDTVTATVYVRKDSAYNGNQPRLIARANAAIGIAADTVLATYSAGTGAWNALSGVTIAATDNGVVEFIIDADGTAGYVNVDDWAFT